MAFVLVASIVLSAGAALAAVKAPHLSTKHTGWRKTDCAGCHDAAGLAKKHSDAAQLRAPACGRCHGYNGAPHEAHAGVAFNPCASCHATVSHLKAFQAPDDCASCHVHPASPTGR